MNLNRQIFSSSINCSISQCLESCPSNIWIWFQAERKEREKKKGRERELFTSSSWPRLLPHSSTPKFPASDWKNLALCVRRRRSPSSPSDSYLPKDASLPRSPRLASRSAESNWLDSRTHPRARFCCWDLRPLRVIFEGFPCWNPWTPIRGLRWSQGIHLLPHRPRRISLRKSPSASWISPPPNIRVLLLLQTLRCLLSSRLINRHNSRRRLSRSSNRCQFLCRRCLRFRPPVPRFLCPCKFVYMWLSFSCCLIVRSSVSSFPPVG